MVTNRTETLIFTWATSTRDSDGYSTAGSTQTLSLLCRPEPNGNRLSIAAPNGTQVIYQYKIFTDPFTTTIPVGATVTVRGISYKLLQAHHYQKHVEIWVG